MQWSLYVQELSSGKTVKMRPKGNSMLPKIKSGQLLTIVPASLSDLEKNDIVFCKVSGKYFVHLVTGKKNEQVQISNNSGHVNGWTKNVYGKVINIED